VAEPITSAETREVLVQSRTLNIEAHTGLRGLAAVVVFLAHLQLDRVFPYDWVRTGCRFLEWQGQAVDLFFMLSGFVLCHVYAFAPSISWRKYGVARFARIYPLTLATLLFCLSLDLYSFLRHGIASENLSMRRLAINGLLLNGLNDTWVHEGINPPSWSISVEVFLYIVLFPLLTVLFRSPIGSRRSVTVSLTLCNLSLLMCCYMFRSHLGPFSEYLWLARGIFGFSFGYSLRQWIEHDGLSVGCRFSPATVSMLSAGAMISILALDGAKFLLLPCLATLVWSTYSNSGMIGKLFSSLPWVYLGERSFSIYMVHHGVIMFCQRAFLYRSQLPSGEFPLSAWIRTMIAILIITGVLSEISYRYFECPSRDAIRRWL
jgi:peptidoglycan/LPS O-acetylase OafA/YrhL